MSQLIYSPFGALNQLHRELGHVFDGGRTYEPATYEPATYEASNWVPDVDIKEDDDAFHVLVDVPGVAAKDVEVTHERNVLTIKGARSTSTETEERGWKRRERVSGSFVRQFTLPDSANEDDITAKAENGVLRITIPKGKENKARTIVVSG
jgi:HSP20 family protein